MDVGAFLERWSTIVANALAIGTVIVGALPTVRWARRVRRELSEIRRQLGTSSKDGVRENATFHNIHLGTKVGNDRWNIAWSRLPDGLHKPDVKQAVARVTSHRLAQILTSNPSRIAKNPIVVGAVRYTVKNDALEDVEVYRLDHATGDRLWLVWFQIRHALWRWTGGAD